MTRLHPLRSLRSLLIVLALVAGALSVIATPRSLTPAAEAAIPVAKQTCRRIDPNLVNGVCLRFSTGHGTALTWIGSYRAPSGRVFFCIDYLYDSRLPARAETVATDHLVNQLGDRVGDREVAGLNYVISTWAAHGSTGSNTRDAAIALIIREVMGDGRLPGGIEVYPAGLRLGGRVLAPRGGLRGPVLGLARSMWREAARYSGPYRLRLTTSDSGPVRLGRQRTYRISVLSSSGRRVPGVLVRLDCRGPVRCPDQVRSKARPRVLVLHPTDLGRFRLRARARGPAADGLLYREHSWHGHAGRTARAAGRQRGWIAQENRTSAVVRATAIVEKARPEVITTASHTEVTPGVELHDVVTVTGLPASYDATVRADLYGPFPEQPGRADCSDANRVGRVRLQVASNGTFETPTIAVAEVGYYTWVESFPGDDATVPVETRCGLVEETTRVIPFTPLIHTATSQRAVSVGDSVHDTITVSGVADTPVELRWSLLGPRAPRDGSCRELVWSAAPVLAHGVITATGDGDYSTPPTTLPRAGCYTYAVDVPATALSDAAASLPGQAVETTLVRRRTPRVTTVASDQRALAGDRIRDAIRLRGLRRTDEVTVRWWLLGPIAPTRGRSCRGLSWVDAPVADRGSLVAVGNGTAHTSWTTLHETGCFTYRERVPMTTATYPTSTAAGLPAETSLVTRPVTPYVPEVPSGYEIDHPTRHARPRYLHRRYSAPPSPTPLARAAAGGTISLPRLHLAAPVAPVGLDHGAVAIPNDTHAVGWLSTTAHVDDLLGSSVISGHVSDRHDRPGALWRLKNAKVGDVVRWREPSGELHRFVVRSIDRFARSHGLPGRYFRTTGPHLLHLVTCTHRTRTSSGGFHYTDNLVVTAEEVTHA